MLGFLKADPTKKLRDRHRKTLARAMQAQRDGDLSLFAELSAQADAMAAELDALERKG